MKNTSEHILIWLFVLPGAVIVYFLTFFEIGFLDFFRAPDDKLDFLLPLVASAFAGFTYITAGVYIVPKYKTQTGFVLLALMIAWSIFLIIYSIKGEEYLKIVANVIQIISSCIGVGYIMNEKNET